VQCTIETEEDLLTVFPKEYHPEIAERLDEIWYLKTFSKEQLYPLLKEKSE